MSTLLQQRQREYAWRNRQIKGAIARIRSVGYQLNAAEYTESLVENIEFLEAINGQRYTATKALLKTKPRTRSKKP